MKKNLIKEESERKKPLIPVLKLLSSYKLNFPKNEK